VIIFLFFLYHARLRNFKYYIRVRRVPRKIFYPGETEFTEKISLLRNPN